MTKGTVILRKIGGLSKIKSIKGKPLEYGQNSKDRTENGELIGEYREPSLPGAKQYLSSQWSDLKDQYGWGGTQEDLARIVKKMALRYPSNHYRNGELIEPKDVNLTDLNDPFFTHKKWFGNKYMEGGRIMLNRDLEEDEFFYFTYKGLDEVVLDKTKNQNAVFKAGAKFEIINPKIVKAKKAQDAKAAVSSLVALSKMDFQRQSLIAEVMDLRTYNLDDKDPDSLFIALKDEGAENEETESRYGGKTGRERFMELAETPNEDLNIMADIIRARRLGILRNRGSYWQFNTGNNTLNDKLDGIQNEVQLINFFRKIDNQDYYIELSKQLQAKGKEKV